MLDDRIKLVTLMGKAGTGKTLLAMAAGLKKTVMDREFRRLVVARAHREDRAPHPARPIARHLEHRAPFVGIADIVGHAEPLRAEVVGGGDDEEAFGVGEAFEVDALALARDAAAAIGADQPAGLDRPRARFDRHAVGALHDPGRFDVEAQGDIVAGRQQLGEDLDIFMLFALEAVRKGGLVGEQAEIEGGDEPLAAIAGLPDRRDDAAFVQPGGDPAFGEHLERRRVEGGGARIARGRVAALDHRHRNAEPRQEQRRRQAARPRAEDDDVIFGGAGHDQNSSRMRPWPAIRSSMPSARSACQ